MRKIRGSEIAVVLQNPMTCFDPLYRIGSQIGETFATHTDWNANEIREKSLETLERHAAEDHDRDRDGIKTGTSDRG